MRRIILKAMATVLAMLALVIPAAAHADKAEAARVKAITVAALPNRIPAVRADGHIETPERPGYRVEFLRSAGKRCGVDVNFAPVPWARALDMLKHGDVEAVFYSSYAAERTAYGAYPMKNGAPDPQKAMNAYTYSLYVHPDSRLTWDGKTATGPVPDQKILVEQGSVAVKLVSEAGLKPVAIANYANMVRMLAEKRADGMLAIDANVDEILAREPRLAGAIKRLLPPFEVVLGYLMFAKPFHTANTALVECFWTALADIRSKPAYKALVKSYNNGQFAE